MPVVRKTITVTEQQDAWITDQVRAGGFTNDSELIRDLIRREQARAAGGTEAAESADHVRWFREQVQAALAEAASGEATYTPLDDVAKRLRSRARRLNDGE